jgi:predicted nucleotidyltransferase
MVSDSDKTVIIDCAQKYNVAAVYLFGSSLNPNAQARDIDLAVKGINPALFFKFYGELLRKLSKPVDLVDLSHKTLFNMTPKANDVSRRFEASFAGLLRQC